MEKDKQDRILTVSGILCLACCLLIAVFNVCDSRLAGADIIPPADYHASLTVSTPDEPEGQATGQAERTVNINTASAEELAACLPGVGEIKARRIVEYRETAGGFDSVDELINVRGIGTKTLENLRPYCRVTDE